VSESTTRWEPWQPVWERALYGNGGFFTAVDAGPSAHFRTAVHAAASEVAAALARLAVEHGRTTVLDIGAGRGELLTAMASAAPAHGLALHGVDVVPRPPDLPARIAWSQQLDRLPADAFDGALVVAWELLDDVPCPVLELDDDGVPRTVLVDPTTGRERLGDPVDHPVAEADLAWVTRWWPLRDAEPGDRIEVGRPRDRFWAALIGSARATSAGAVLLAVDYAHSADDRPPPGSLSGFRSGRAVPPVPDGSCDVTAHVALDAVAAAGEQAGATGTRLTDQATALRELGVGGPLVHQGDVHQDDVHQDDVHQEPYGQGPETTSSGLDLLRRLAARSRTAELLDPGSLGGFGWLLQRAGC
jgi:SAM-dependent MidA family methyltransferase